jgi:hypothetical protein
MTLRTFFSLLLATFFLNTCTAQEPLKILRPNGGKQVVVLADSAQAARYIIYDQTDRYFDLVNPSEMSIQMKKSLSEPINTAQWRIDYKKFLQGDMRSFSTEETKFLQSVMDKVYKTAIALNPAIVPDTLVLIKTRGRHYGDGVYYTRENTIVIPANELEARKTNPFTTTMYHELFHVYSRLNPAKRKALYQLIGFESLAPNQLVMPDALRERVLYNPDGVDFAQRIQLKTEDDKTISAIPVIYSKYLGHQEGNNEFFGYVEFNLYQIQPANETGKWKVLTRDDGYTSVLNVEKLPDFFKQIKDNTGYIIHPDEVLADNFSFIMLEKNGSKVTAKFSPEGKKLLTEMEAILKSK